MADYRTKKPTGKYISYSQYKMYSECPHKYNLRYILKAIKGSSSIDTAFGKALHDVCENKIKDETKDETALFVEKFREQLQKMPKEDRKPEYTPELMQEYREQGERLVKEFLSEFKRQYADEYEVVATEEELLVPIDDTDYRFYGFVDLIVKNKITNKYTIFDHKTTKSGWHPKKLSDKLNVYQLSLYKYFWAKKHNIPLEDIETGYVFFKRTAKKNIIEMTKITNGEKRIKNSYDSLYTVVSLIKMGTFVKNLLSCDRCFDKEACKNYKGLTNNGNGQTKTN